MTTLGIILARAGSAGLPNKHLLPLLGRPVIRYSFDHARSAQCLSRVVVSSDCEQILALAAAEGFQTIRRPPHLATADASVQDVLLHSLAEVEALDRQFRADAVVLIYGNVPLRGDGVIDRAVELLAETGCDSVRSFCPVGKWHPAWMAQLQGDKVIAVEGGSIHRRQDLAPLFLHDGAVVAVSRRSLLLGLEAPENPHAFFGDDRRGIATAAGESVEIDDLRDLYLARAILQEKRGRRSYRIAG